MLPDFFGELFLTKHSNLFVNIFYETDIIEGPEVKL